MVRGAHKRFGEPKTDPKLFKLNELSGSGWEKICGMGPLPTVVANVAANGRRSKIGAESAHTPNQTKPNQTKPN